MKKILEDLIDHLTLERLDLNFFRGQSHDIGSSRVFGGQVLGQALAAASATVEDRRVHSLHAYFLRMGDHRAPILYEVDRQRDGRSFTSRRVVAIQNGRPIFNFAASFVLPEEGLEHQAAMPDVPPPGELREFAEYRDELFERFPETQLPRFLLVERPFEFRPVQTPSFIDPELGEPRTEVWFRTVGELPDAEDLHRAILAYASDYNLIGAATRPHEYSVFKGELVLASLDHAMWFYRPFRVDEWLLYAVESPSAAGGRALCRGLIYREDGALVAAVAQEGVMRVRRQA